MSFWDDLTGQTAADASKAAAADQYGKQQSAVQRLLGYGDQFKTGTDANAQGFDPYIQNYDPYVASGRQANNALSMLMSNPESVRSLPGYQFNQAEGTRAIDRSAAARGIDASGRTLKDLLRFGTGLADNTFGNQWSRLLGLSQQGLGATGAQASLGGQQIGLQQQGLQGQLGARTTAYGGDMGSAGTIGQGDIAAANAKAAGSQNILNTGVKLAGMAFGGYGGGSLGSLMGGGGTGGSISGGGGGYDPNTNMPLYSAYGQRPLYA